MKPKTIFFLLLALGAWCTPFAAGQQAQLIEPTRSLQGTSEAAGQLNVLSEPPGIEVQLDGRVIGKTPIFSIKLPAGAHVLRIRDSETGIQIEPGRTAAITWFKGAFMAIPQKTQPARETGPGSPVPAAKTEPPEAPAAQPAAPNDPFYWPLNPRGPIY